jgi:hypothetical protein
MRAYAIPDLDIAKPGHPRLWVEVKDKTTSTWTRNIASEDHGIPLRHYKDYLQVEAITRTPVWIVICEHGRQPAESIQTTGVTYLYQSLQVLGNGRIAAIRGDLTVFWPRNCFKNAPDGVFDFMFSIKEKNGYD